MKYTRIATIALAIAAIGNSVQAQATLPPAQAEVRKIDLENKKITLKHGEIKNLNMPGMTMVFVVKDAKFLDDVKTGDKVSFTADHINGVFTVLSIKKAN
ncbi:MAG: copper-binding protein [Polaromonas sp.]|nr:copper-binding protein [Polaromonas sp.]